MVRGVPREVVHRDCWNVRFDGEFADALLEFRIRLVVLDEAHARIVGNNTDAGVIGKVSHASPQAQEHVLVERHMNQPNKILPGAIGNDTRFTEDFQEKIEQLLLWTALDWFIGCGFPAPFEAPPKLRKPHIVIVSVLDVE